VGESHGDWLQKVGSPGDTESLLMERILRSARGHENAEAFDRADLDRLSFEERINAVEQLRKAWFGENRAQAASIG
jgi:hypothetical protein